MGDDYEITMCTIKLVVLLFSQTLAPFHVHEWYRAADWDKEPIWTGRLRIVRKNNRVWVLLEHTDKVGLFVGCVIDTSANNVEAVQDSSRYFVIRVHDEKSGKKASLGVGFNNRDEAFDFKVGLQEAEKAEMAPEPVKESNEPPMDFSLKGPIKLGSGIDPKTKSVKARSSGGGSTAILAPPAASKKAERKTASSAHSEAKDNDILGLGNPKKTTDDDWASFD